MDTDKRGDIEQPGPCAVDGCGNEADADYDLCASCQGYYEFCEVCGAWVSGDHGCRHLYWSPLLSMYSGCGSTDIDWGCDIRPCVRQVLTSLGEVLAVRLRNGLASRRYRSGFSGSMLGAERLDFEVGGRWSDGRGGGACRAAFAPPDTDDPQTGRYLVNFAAPDGDTPQPVCDQIGRILTSEAFRLEAVAPNYETSEWLEGVMWLSSLSARADCREAERATVEWIDEWLANAAGFELRAEGDTP